MPKREVNNLGRGCIVNTNSLMQTNDQPVGFSIICEPNVWLVIYAFPCLYTWLISQSIFIRLKHCKKTKFVYINQRHTFCLGIQPTLKNANFVKNFNCVTLSIIKMLLSLFKFKLSNLILTTYCSKELINELVRYLNCKHQSFGWMVC